MRSYTGKQKGANRQSDTGADNYSERMERASKKQRNTSVQECVTNDKKRDQIEKQEV